MSIEETLIKHITEFETAQFAENEASPTGYSRDFHTVFLKADARFRIASKTLNLTYPSAPPDGTYGEQMSEILERYGAIVSSWKGLLLARKFEIEAALEYETATGEFSESILFDEASRKTMGKIVEAMRTEVHSSEWLGADRKRRVLTAINAVQTEIDKEISNFHLVLGKVVDLGDALGKAGDKAKPAFDRIEQLANAIRGRRKETLEIEKDTDPLKIEDLRHEPEE
ncbi:hypothetical protein [Candidatus Halocynthiibacter alkanivorans]|uniref:hypothetical protein n=1 Tax=Candidatus Halocynthiibacter alkanivorans TaxID=2267619 RepID=UPI00109D632C|nr:hypothetical protein [Candidatus Halocynthiibacter alkanivorans]